MPPPRLLLARFLLGLLGLAAGLALAEGLARALVPRWKPPWAERATFWRHDPLLGWSLKPGRRGHYSGPGFRVHVSINSRGLRDREHALARSPGGPRRVLLLGDSFGWGYGVERDSTLAGQLDRPAAGVECVNGSVSGYCTAQQLLWYRTEGFRYRADLVLVLVCANDLGDNPGPRLYWYRKPYFELAGDSLVLQGVPVPRPTLADRAHLWVVGRTYLGSGLREALWAWKRWRARAAAPAAQAITAAASPEDSAAFRITHAILRALAADTRAHGSRLALALVPMPRGLAAWWRETAGAEGLPLVDLQPVVGTRPEVLLPNDTHWNARGNARAAEALRPFLDSLLALPTPSPAPPR